MKNDMKIVIHYNNMKFEFLTEDDSCWFNLDHAISNHGKYKMEINADRDAYAYLYYDDKKIEGYITEDDEKNPIADNFPLEEEAYYQFIRLKKPGYYL